MRGRPVAGTGAEARAGACADGVVRGSSRSSPRDPHAPVRDNANTTTTPIGLKCMPLYVTMPAHHATIHPRVRFVRAAVGFLVHAGISGQPGTHAPRAGDCAVRLDRATVQDR